MSFSAGMSGERAVDVSVRINASGIVVVVWFCNMGHLGRSDARPAPGSSAACLFGDELRAELFVGPESDGAQPGRERGVATAQLVGREVIGVVVVAEDDRCAERGVDLERDDPEPGRELRD